MKSQDNNDYQVIWGSFIANGNQEAIGMIYFGHYDLLYNFGLKYTCDVQIIEDAIQNIFSYFLKSGSKLSPAKNLRGYLLQSFRHQLLLDIKKRNRTFHLNNVKGENSDRHEPEVNEIFEQEWSSRLMQKLRICMEHLTEKQKEILYLRFQCELSYAEIAIILDIAVDSCQKLVYRSLKELRVDLEKWGGNR
ncbi:MAG: sigma-70 family RNA polymerase sigma factor [Prolixibacteraceae bacterium]|jgi:RNA polymerase sigma factor (sigma-70 family)|nr:sigma-70 family RNA polymerase sigma factor [Prolixibacteraceae bacterium]